MDAETVRWLGAGAGTLILGLIVYIYTSDRARSKENKEALDRHIEEDTKIHERVTLLEAEMKSVRREIGDHDSGIVKRLHHYSKSIRTLYAKFNLKDD